MTTPTWEIRQGDVLERLREMPDGSVHCVVTSPPYWGLRDYGTAQWEGGLTECDHLEPQGGQGTASAKQNTSVGSQVMQYKTDCLKCGAIRSDNQIGLEPTPEAYVAKMVDVFREVRRVLRSDGTLWLNLGDSYNSSTQFNNNKGARYTEAKDGNGWPGHRPLLSNLKNKDLVGIPWMVAFALRADSWYLRSDIIWSKPNPMPESVTDRPTKSHEYVFLLSRSARYFYDGDAIREPYNLASISRYDSPMMGTAPTAHQPNGDIGRRERDKGLRDPNPLGRNIRSVWNIATQPFSEAHFATFPERLVDRCISAGTSKKGVCGECGKPWARRIERVEGVTHQRELAHVPNGCHTKVDSTGWQPMTRATDQWERQCNHDTLPVPATVLDIFSGSGTSGVVAHKLGRNYIGIELNPQYVVMSERRLGGTIYQPSLFG